MVSCSSENTHHNTCRILYLINKSVRFMRHETYKNGDDYKTDNIISYVVVAKEFKSENEQG
ncbi:hypothetical protein NQ317_006561 [Molorchus minor]|uniref:Uncharacterized protein n=1 Tax=Molorchus minor TaxID=1323400 RepID=A0ABQ9K0E0_9CUCU|nr:hypothetical protein NQ317_006561 [Molorchus minor]